jgi:hypothetical protein
VPPAGWWCALVALVTGLAWSMLTPPFHVPDENSHIGYVQYVAETGNLPVRTPNRAPYSDEQNALLHALHFFEVIGRVGNRPPLTAAQTRALREVQAQDLNKVGPDVNNATENGPLYYLLAAVPYWTTPSGDLLDRMVVIRLLSVLFAALTALAVFLFVRELLPGDPWTWTVGGLLAALEPMVGFLGGGVSPDSLLTLISSATILMAARVLRRGLTARRAVILALLTVAGVLTKPAFLGLVPGAVVALLAGVVVARGRESYRAAGIGAAAAAAVGAFYLLLTHTVLERTAAAAEVVPEGEHGWFERLSYMWQLFLPRLPFQTDLIDGFPLHDLWAPRLLGQFGWLDYGYPAWVYDVFWWTCMALLVAFVVALVRGRAAVRRRALELFTYATFVAGVLFAIGYVDYRSRITGTALFEQGRYLLPLLALMAGAVCVALRGLGPRWGRPVGALLVMAMLAATVFGQLLTVERFYG